MSDLEPNLVRRDEFPKGRTDLGNFSNVWDIVLWVTDGLDVDCLGLLIDRTPKLLRVIGFHPLYANIEFLEEYYEGDSSAPSRSS